MKLRLLAWVLMIAATIFTWYYSQNYSLLPEPMTSPDQAGNIPLDSDQVSHLPPYPSPPQPAEWAPLNGSDRVKSAKERVLPLLTEGLKALNLELGAPVFVRVFKESRELEVWLQAKGKEWILFRTHPIAAMSGRLGPKLKEGDLQAPEGFYSVATPALNPLSSYHLSFNIGYPNAFDRFHNRTGGLIMVHGRQASIGCFAMTDRVIEEIYLLVEAALSNGQPNVPVHIFPFRMTDIRMLAETENPWYDFWEDLRGGYDLFESTGQPPEISLRDGHYQCVAAPVPNPPPP